jgi:putative phage-type endonuclease
MKVYNLEQRSPEWYALKAGLPSASNFDKIVTSKGVESKQQKQYLYKLAGEKLLGKTEDGYRNSIMEKAIILEEEARNMYSLITSQEVEQVGFCLDDSGLYGVSPDGLVGDDGLLEIKCPLLSTHIEYLLNNKLPTEYFQQVQGQLMVTGRKWCDFMSYYEGIKPFIIRVNRDEAFINCLQNSLQTFCQELAELIEKIK